MNNPPNKPPETPAADDGPIADEAATSTEPPPQHWEMCVPVSGEELVRALTTEEELEASGALPPSPNIVEGEILPPDPSKPTDFAFAPKPPEALAPPLEAAVNGFLEHAVEADKTAFTSTAELMTAAQRWCDEKGEWRFGARALAKQLRRRGALQAKSTNGYSRGWRGIRLK
jgi:hypothetical protein